MWTAYVMHRRGEHRDDMLDEQDGFFTTCCGGPTARRRR